MIAISVALPEESKEFIAHCREVRKSGNPALPLVRARLSVSEIAIVHTGMGMARAKKSIESFLQENQPKMLISAGFAGGLSPDLQTGQIVVNENFSSPELLEKMKRFFANSEVAVGNDLDSSAPKIVFGDLKTTENVAETVADKTTLFAKTGALAVDMETLAISETCRAHGLPMLSLRAISDAADVAMPLPQEVWFDAEKQRPRPASLVAHLLSHPGKIAPFVRFVRGVGIARRALTAQLLETVKRFGDDG